MTLESKTKLGVDKTAMDASVPPQNDFFRYVNGSWLDSAEIPPDKSRYGAFDKLMDKSEADVLKIIKRLTRAKHERDTDAQKIADIYKSFMDEEAVEARGLDPIREDLDAVERIDDKARLAVRFARADLRGVGSPLALYVAQDGKKPTAYITHLVQSGLGLPDRDYYFKDDETTARARGKYLGYVTTLLRLAGVEDSAGKARAVYALEKALAEHHWTAVERRDRDKTYNKTAVGDLGALAPGFDWDGYLRAADIRPQERDVIVAHPSYFKGFAAVLAERTLDDWKLYMKLRTLEAFAAFLPAAYVEADFDYRGRALRGQPEIRPRWKRATDLVNGAVGELVGKIYVKEHFPESSKKRMRELVENLRQAYAERIQGLEWMSADTKKKALEKLAKFTPKIGYPDKWKDYARLKVDPGDLVGNVKRANLAEHLRMVEKLGKPVDRDEWLMFPQTVNAYYSPNKNEIVFPAGILQTPFFNPDADDAVNYGSIGAVIGHEMGHGFDDQGSKMDGDGELRDWWTPEDKEAFKERTAKLVGQYGSFEPFPGERLNGELTLGENIGDLGGLTVAHHAYRLSLGGKEAPAIDGFTGAQRFFLGWAQVWRTKAREEDLRKRLIVDPHSPPEYRVNGVVRNMPEFYEAFGVKESHALFLPRDERVSIW